jgi:hypothetical protein
MFLEVRRVLRRNDRTVLLIELRINFEAEMMQAFANHGARQRGIFADAAGEDQRLHAVENRDQ